MTRLSDKAPRSATIISRNAAGAAVVPTYSIKIGNSILPDVTLDEIYDFVSPQDFHVFEHAAFQRENEERDQRLLEKHLLRAQFGRRGRGGKPLATSDSATSDSNDETPEEDIFDAHFTQAPPVEIGRHGRPRPEYGQFYLKRGGRGRGRSSVHAHSASDQDTTSSAGRGRGRGRGRPRGSRAAGTLSRAAFHHDKAALWEAASGLSLEEPPKRRRLDTYDYDSFRRRDAAAVVGEPRRKRTESSDAPVQQQRLSPVAVRSVEVRPRSPAVVQLTSIGLATGSDSSSVASSGSSVSSQAPAPVDPAPESSSEDEEEEEEESEYEIDRILSHQLSDPATHPPELAAVMLYEVKWVGYGEPTWEPMSSFVDQKVVKEYWARRKGKMPAAVV